MRGAAVLVLMCSFAALVYTSHPVAIAAVVASICLVMLADDT